MVNHNETRTEKGLSLARGPALVLGTILLAAGLYFIYKQHTFPKFANFPDGKAPVDGKVLFGIFGANGWTGMLTAIGGGLLLFGAAQHLLAKTMSLIVGIAFGAAAIIAALSGDVLGLAAANGWTEIGWGIAAAILLFNTLIPRRRREVVEDTGYAGEPGRRRRGLVLVLRWGRERRRGPWPNMSTIVIVSGWMNATASPTATVSRRPSAPPTPTPSSTVCEEDRSRAHARQRALTGMSSDATGG